MFFTGSYGRTVYDLNSVWTDPKSVCLSCTCMRDGVTCQNLQELCDLTCSVRAYFNLVLNYSLLPLSLCQSTKGIHPHKPMMHTNIVTSTYFHKMYTFLLISETVINFHLLSFSLLFCLIYVFCFFLFWP